MNKIAYNNCYGGFTLSKKAVDWLEENCTDNELRMVIEKEKSDIMADEKISKICKYSYICCGVSCWFDEKRHHDDLIAVIELLGDEASGDCAELRIFRTSSNLYRIDDYDGFESVIIPDQQDWIHIEKKTSRLTYSNN